MKQVSDREFVRLVERNGWALARIQGSHHIFTKAGRRKRPVVAIHQPLMTGLLRGMMKIANFTADAL